MMDFSARVTSQRKRWWGSQSEFNNLVRQALRAAARLWLERMLPQHFGVMAFGRYNYKPRSSKYQEGKRTKKFVRATSPSKLAGQFVPNPNFGQAPAPLRYTGELEEFIKSKSVDEYLGTALVSATSNVQRIRVKIPLPHPLNTKNAGEITKIIPSERAQLTQKAHGELARLMHSASVQTTKAAA